LGVGVETLHVTNGDSVLYLWKKAGLLGTHLAWRDALHEGPVPAGRDLEELSRIRARYLAENGFGNGIKIGRDFEKRDAMLRRAAEFDEVVLWFEHDLYDQLQILQIVDALAAGNLRAGSVQLIQSDQYLGLLSPDELMSLLPKRRTVTTAVAQGARRAWASFTSDAPLELNAATNAQFVGLPFLRESLKRLCEEFPAIDSGLSRTEKQILMACEEGARTLEQLFRRSQAHEEAAFLSDAACAAIVARLCAAPEPLLATLEDGYELTVLGRRVRGGDTDWLDHQPVDRWIGGTHLTLQRQWRWDDRTDELIEYVAAAEPKE